MCSTTYSEKAKFTGFGVEYFIRTGCEDDKKFLKGYKSVLNSKNSEESLVCVYLSSPRPQAPLPLPIYLDFFSDNIFHAFQANFAAWEPCHGRFPFRHPWKLYLKVGTLARECAYRIQALNGCLNADIQV